MLYVSTRNKTDSFTAFRALMEDHTPDGGLFVPFRLPVYDENALNELKKGTFSDNVAQLLNLFFSAGLTGWDVEFCAGRYPAKVHTMPHRMWMAELWHNLDSAYTALEKSLYKKLSGADRVPSNWAKIAIRVAVLFGLYPELSAAEGESFDIAVAVGDFTAPMAAWYARKMGLPVGMIICGCNKNGAAWDLLHRGEYNTAAPIRATQLPELDVSASEGLERLVYETFGTDKSCVYRDICAQKGAYLLLGEDLNAFNKGLFVSVVSDQRAMETVNSLWRTNAYVADPYTALICAALQDYRAKTGESRMTLVLAERSPMLFADMICKATDISPSQLKTQVDKG